MQPIKIIISGGGTGGHIFPAIAIANALKQLQPNTEILFVGAQGKMEMEKVPTAGYKIIGLPVVGLQRRLTLKNLKFPFLLYKSLQQAKRIIKEFNPAVVVGVGGYASGPMLKIACKKNIATLIQEQNSFPGLTNRLLAKKVNKICVAYPNMENFFPKNKIILTGNPVRQDISNLEAKRARGYELFQLSPNQKTVLVVGGSLGAKTINESILAGLENFSNHQIQLIWQTGKSFYEVAKNATQKYHKNSIFCFDFISQMDYAYAIADVVVSRAGAISISEICLAAKAAILVPSPNVAEDHQTKNALALINNNAAELVKDNEAKELLVKKVIDLLNDDNHCERLQRNAYRMAFSDAANVIAAEVLKLANP
ncbi:MAG: undecaprenyldiphospho-muramoylpentapeptide beta-N-acetylglucosaminyltransferase [Bacteroidetes bacterium]|nr:undecaprenyldiphospho-muramoylpentapeptide beta-N-acetylglucosaminyltransferase [Bacteroidota bacterium]MBV6460323.1 UDP-N-acetylglucosamine--N-acetylmuramyl-(pentapeptide) pyrophosphoryl-undecaprenol N-acetylglucosamine transferase [Flavobacteriales bacterium]WKZ74690.1 MAG: undecaprenyldiphospho-muramoylpentapeptide beta-N-acetylglucosaminyltransferase [Vicingaceae bacterium]MCL4815811.1 undecaprenyldiphospho-muramoylpentapeptide beta-N-acetylglucosaminyltransferase [Flavobacteriales bacter